MKLNFDSENSERKATQNQIKYIQLLSNDLGFSIIRRNAHIKEIVKLDFNADVNNLSLSQASVVIQKFKSWKENKENL